MGELWGEHTVPSVTSWAAEIAEAPGVDVLDGFGEADIGDVVDNANAEIVAFRRQRHFLDGGGGDLAFVTGDPADGIAVGLEGALEFDWEFAEALFGRRRAVDGESKQNFVSAGTGLEVFGEAGGRQFFEGKSFNNRPRFGDACKAVLELGRGLRLGKIVKNGHLFGNFGGTTAEDGFGFGEGQPRMGAVDQENRGHKQSLSQLWENRRKSLVLGQYFDYLPLTEL